MNGMAFRERDTVRMGVAGLAVIAVLLVVAFHASAIVHRVTDRQVEAVFAEAGNLATGDDVRVAGRKVGEVSSVRIEAARVVVGFHVPRKLALGDRTRAAIGTATVLGRKYLGLTPDGGGDFRRIPLRRTTSAYDLARTLATLTDTTRRIDSRQLARSLTEFSRTFADTPDELGRVLSGLDAVAGSAVRRDDELRSLLARAASVSRLLADRRTDVQHLIEDGDALLTALVRQRAAFDHLFTGISRICDELTVLVQEGRKTLRPALIELRDLLRLVNRNRGNLDLTLQRFGPFARSLGEAVGSGPFFMANIGNLTPDDFPPGTP